MKFGMSGMQGRENLWVDKGMEQGEFSLLYLGIEIRDKYLSPIRFLYCPMGISLLGHSTPCEFGFHKENF